MIATRVTRPMSLESTLRCCQRIRFVSTLPNNPYIYAHQDPLSPSKQILSLLPTSPPVFSLAMGTTTQIPPTPSSFTPNPTFLPILHSVLAKHATQDPAVRSQAAAYASQSSNSSSFLFPPNHPSQQNQNKRSVEKRSRAPGAGFVGASGKSSGPQASRTPIDSHKTNTTGAGPTATQGGAGSGGRGGFVHVSDTRHPPDFGRIADPEDIFGTVEVDGEGNFITNGGNYQDSGTYRIITREGILGLTPFLRDRLVERLKELEKEENQ
ncbi:Sodium/potassium-transporting ATPase subunit [Venturia nashicola]|uniref:Sodium/potassium-transporting ATPase subunit n=1 Tax=Venturia nashicola TaxID=86259 RepID=A0A4Z1PC30_9PEZI|nr:Sodium/potassium-transporting ATPase subunit [Venturia nashicola]